MKKVLKYLGYSVLGLILLVVGLFLLGEISAQFKYNHKYSIAMPTINGEYDIKENFITISGLSNIVNDQIATLSYSELKCLPTFKDKPCTEMIISISGLGNQIIIYPYHNEYKIKYADKNKIIFKSLTEDVTGEIDLNDKTLVYTVKNAGFNANETRKIEIITDNQEIEKLEKKIIRKYLKRKWFKN